ncbi:carbohydrate-binding protein [Catellatospora sichuanensis]|uniref:carbohydrate-binding protein n=1 Tax=Catellatospora sichuanensis TaxID=1969805 RepID=UPI001182039C|nr:carbohydrate-binding protein [Catellatospora sichuanensis]
MEDDFGYEGRRRIRVPLLERLRVLPLVAAGVFTAALILLLLTTIHRPATWNDALPWDDQPSAEPVAAPIYPDAPAAHSPGPRTPAARPSTTRGSAPAPAASPSPAARLQQRTMRYEAESASRSQARTANDHSGYSGSGFVDYDNASGAYLQWSVRGTAGRATLRLRFANASCCNRAMEISVNGGTVLRDVRFDPMRTWDDWNTVTVTVTLTAGTNTVRATATSGEGGPNIDYLEVVQ